jgi:hypothetical protein
MEIFWINLGAQIAGIVGTFLLAIALGPQLSALRCAVYHYEINQKHGEFLGNHVKRSFLRGQSRFYVGILLMAASFALQIVLLLTRE